MSAYVYNVLGCSDPVIDQQGVTLPISLEAGAASLRFPLKMFLAVVSRFTREAGDKRRPTMELAYEAWKNSHRSLSKRTICHRLKLNHSKFIEYVQQRELEDEMAACDMRIICVLSREDR